MYNCVWCSALVVLAVVVWSWDASCVHCVKVIVRTNDDVRPLYVTYNNNNNNTRVDQI